MRGLSLVVVALAVGCGSSGTQIETKTALAAFSQAGFRGLAVLANHQAFTQLDRLQPLAAGQKALDVDTIVTRGATLPLAPLAATRFPSISMAKRRIENDQPLLQNRLSAQQRTLLPHSFDAAHLREVRVCNVVMSSYNPSDNPALRARFDRAVGLLRKHC